MTLEELLKNDDKKSRLLVLFLGFVVSLNEQEYTQPNAEMIDAELLNSNDLEEGARFTIEHFLNRNCDATFMRPLVEFEGKFKRLMFVLERWQFLSKQGGRMISDRKNAVRSYGYFKKIVVPAVPGVWNEYTKDGRVMRVLDSRAGELSMQALRELEQDKRDRERDIHRGRKLQESDEQRKFKERGFPYSDSYQEYIRFLQNNFESMQLLKGVNLTLENILSILIPYPVGADTLQRGHTYIVGRSGSGKSELIKGLCNRFENKFVLLDPHGDLADEVARLGIAPPRIVPHERRTVINPFDIQDKSQENRELVAQEITDLVAELVEDSGLSRLMTTIMFPIVYTLLKLPYADFKMLTDCISPTTGKTRLGSIKHLVEPHHLAIWRELESDTYDTSKQSVFNRLQSLLNYRLVMQTICGRDDFSEYVEKPLNERGTGVIVSLPIPTIGETVAVTLGRFFMTRMQIWAKRRQTIPKHERKPVVFFVDEFHNFMSKSTADTLDQYGRKFGLYLVLAHQHLQQISDREIRGSVMANTVNKIAGMSNIETRQAMAREMGIEADELDGLRPGHFVGRFGSEKPFSFYARMVRQARPKPVSYLQTLNGAELVDGWDGFDQEEAHQATSGKAVKVPKKGFKPKFDI